METSGFSNFKCPIIVMSVSSRGWITRFYGSKKFLTHLNFTAKLKLSSSSSSSFPSIPIPSKMLVDFFHVGLRLFFSSSNYSDAMNAACLSKWWWRILQSLIVNGPDWFETCITLDESRFNKEPHLDHTLSGGEMSPRILEQISSVGWDRVPGDS